MGSWVTIASNYAWDDRSKKMTIEKAMQEQGVSDPADKRDFRDGWRRGRIGEAVWTLQNLMKYLRATDMQELGDDLQRLANKYEARLELYGGDDTPADAPAAAPTEGG